MSKITVGLRIDKDIWEGSRKVLKDIGLSRSAFIQIVLEGVMLGDNEKSLAEQIKITSHKLVDKVKLKI